MSFLRTISKLVKGAVTTGLALVSTLALFLLLPVINQIAEGQDTVYDIDELETEFKEEVEEVVEEEDEPEDEEPEEQEEPELEPEPLEDLSLAQLELMMDAGEGLGGEGVGGSLLDMQSLIGQAAATLDELVDAGGLDSGRPVPINVQAPNLTAAQQKHTPGRVVLIYQITPQGRTQNIKVKSATNQVLAKASLSAARKWRYQPPRKDGKGVTVRAMKTLKFADQK